MDVQVVTTGMRELRADLASAPAEVTRDAEAIVARSAAAIQRDWTSRWSGFASAPSLGAAVSSDVRPGFLGGITAEIGPDKGRRQGALGNLLEFGSVNNAPHPGGAPALDAEAPRFQLALQQAAGDALD